MTPRTCVMRDAWITLGLLALLVLWDVLGLDLAVVRRFGTAEGFAWRDAWLTRQVLHEGGRALAWLTLAAVVLDTWRMKLTGPHRREKLYWVGVMLVCLLLVPALKRLSQTSCPWDLAEFGGSAHYVSHWLWGVPDGGPGHCFPSGHGVAAFAFLGLYFLWRPHRPQAARRVLVGVWVVGSLFGMAQLLRGAHYPSHTFWSAWLCWAICATASAWRHRNRLARRQAPDLPFMQNQGKNQA